MAYRNPPFTPTPLSALFPPDSPPPRKRLPIDDFLELGSTPPALMAQASGDASTARQTDSQPETKLEWPTDHRVYRNGFGSRTLAGKPDFHTGMDIRAHKGDRVKAADHGQVIDVSHTEKGGNQIRIRHEDGSITGYAHTRPTVKMGQTVDRGETIGHSDGSGNVVPHLHFTYRPAIDKPKENPLPHLPKAEKIKDK
ncbi:MAG: M23 family metallopeptidase [Nitrospirae bacterium]|nr:M23 family metallopeptidase [Nitrospirota bacterium]